MKRLLFFLLLLAISGCSNNLSYKTKEGKKNFIREDTVQLQKLTRDDFKEKYGIDNVTDAVYQAVENECKNL